MSNGVTISFSPATVLLCYTVHRTTQVRGLGLEKHPEELNAFYSP